MITDGRLFKKGGIWPGAPVIDDPGRIWGIATGSICLRKNANGIPEERGDFFQEAFTAALLGELEEENDWGLPVTPEGKMEERKRKYAAALHSVVQ